MTDGASEPLMREYMTGQTAARSQLQPASVAMHEASSQQTLFEPYHDEEDERSIKKSLDDDDHEGWSFSTSSSLTAGGSSTGLQTREQSYLGPGDSKLLPHYSRPTLQDYSGGHERSQSAQSAAARLSGRSASKSCFTRCRLVLLIVLGMSGFVLLVSFHPPTHTKAKEMMQALQNSAWSTSDELSVEPPQRSTPAIAEDEVSSRTAIQTLSSEPVAPSDVLIVTNHPIATSTAGPLSSQLASNLATEASFKVINSPSASTSSLAPLPTEIHPVRTQPSPLRMPSGNPEEKFLGYLPHSGFHNQRIELRNAMSLAAMLNRTLLVPPIWIGWPPYTQNYLQLQETWDRQYTLHADAFAPFSNASRLAKRQTSHHLTAEECKSYAKECKSTYKNTFISWDFLADLYKAERDIRLVDRFDVRLEHLFELTNTTQADVFQLTDTGRGGYWNLFIEDDPPALDPDGKPFPMFHRLSPEESKYHTRVSVPLLRQQPEKLMLMGSIFGDSRIKYTSTRHKELQHEFGQSLAFDTELLNRPANKLRDMMGGSDNYIGVHARVGDGFFQEQATENMQTLFEHVLATLQVPTRQWRRLTRMGPARMRQRTSSRGIHSPRAASRAHKLLRRAHAHRELVPSSDMDEDDYYDAATVERRQVSSTVRPLPVIKSAGDLPLDPALVCRGALYTEPDLLPLNTPVYLATDAPHPEDHPALSVFFAVFPCTFILSDFDRASPHNTGPIINSLIYLEKSVNAGDHIGLGRLLIPFLEAMVAAKGAFTVGTTGSTFSGFATGELRRVYRQQWDAQHA
ncbi:uncharacterized protein L969DRAFT_58563 [Mixia osmundae IAM 14324]|uniref:Uncharacterized protein n=1 Tax=Mixia osmundae (strain CBS 9802 / IAM 14324 / JCM 22182 / KY 12970) TaxID=764103 RepID=G7DYB8_MIXOS|nr:uncharacterized protein L969DRAFT_58563 [Mixia osmundae IAM 14324]KEI41480.1 hypothetical protein L969DRAFT_58563 [Mixia osmundae IAM 14324]GAA95578.1 hypothetical protein E5Q_02233 [Mixia osmundae IAM 14324]